LKEEIKSSKPVYKKWWFWVILVLVIGAIGAMIDDEDQNISDNESEPVAAQVDNSHDKDNDTNNENVDNVANEEEPENVTENDEGKTEFGINEKIEFEGRILEVTDVEFSDGTEFDKPKEGMEYVIVSVTIENNSDKELSYNPFDFKMQNSQGQIVDQAFTIVNSDTSLSSGDLAPGGSVSGTIAFEQPKADPELQLIFEPSFWSNKRVTVSLN